MLALIANGEDPRAAKQEAVRTAAETVEIVARRFIERHAKVQQPRPGRRPAADRARDPAALGQAANRLHHPADVIALLDAIVDRGAPVTANRTLATGASCSTGPSSAA